MLWKLSFDFYIHHILVIYTNLFLPLNAVLQKYYHIITNELHIYISVTNLLLTTGYKLS